ncbi:MAG: branched-chain amino acid ABC transporter permease [Burkholderiales bacterium]
MFGIRDELTSRPGRSAAIAALVLIAIAAPFAVNTYVVSFLNNLLGFVVMATAWMLFSGTTRYISLATAAFFGLGAYLVAGLGELLPFGALMIVVAFAGFVVALVVGLSTLRLSGVYFTIFTFGLTELVRQLVTWYQVKVIGSVGSYIFVEAEASDIYWRLLALSIVLYCVGFVLLRSRIGLALNAIGADETVAKHSGINVTAVKIGVFALSAVFMTLTGAIMAPRWTYIDPPIAFNMLASFEVLIMALLGGVGRLWGPIVGVVPILIVSEFLATRFPNYFTILLGLAFMAIVYFIPRGVVGVLETYWPKRGAKARSA